VSECFVFLSLIPIKNERTDLLESARTIEPFKTQLTTLCCYFCCVGNNASSAGLSLLWFRSSRGETVTNVFSLSRPGEQSHRGCCRHRYTRGAMGKKKLEPSGYPEEGEAKGDGGARRRQGRWVAVDIYRRARSGDVQRRKMKFHKWPIARDIEGSVGDGGRR